LPTDDNAGFDFIEGPASHQLDEAVVGSVQDTSLVEERVDQICDAALELFLQKGFASTTIRDICAKSGINQASIYDYIANKNDILRRLLNKLWFRADIPTLSERLKQSEDVSLEENVARYLRDAWSKKRKGTLLVYRSVPHLLEDDRKTMRARDLAVIEELAGQLKNETGLAPDDPRNRVVANLILFLSAFAPMRDWLTKDVDDELILRTVSAGVAAMVKQIAADSESEEDAE
jgi:AcrR family transcriptional regulator|tara:strand:+ start:51468 stop:52166 length:699 start_codon:yes stop_codon:yes gene_type:complete